MKAALALLVLLAAGAVGGYFALRSRAEEVCHSALELARYSDTVSAWLKEAGADPFLGAAALRGPPNAIFALYRDRSRRIGTELSARFLPPAPLAAFSRLGLTRGEGPELERALEELRPASAALVCRAPALKPDDELAKLVSAADLFWAERRAVSVMEKQEFARDQQIFCRGEGLLRKLQAVVMAAGEACHAAAPGTKLAKSCGSGHLDGTGGVQAEIHDLEQQKELNLRKLRQKWPEAVVAGLRC